MPDPPTSRAWNLAKARPDEAARLGNALGLSPLAAQLLLNRGVSELEVARRHLDPRLGHLRAPEGGLPMAGFAAAVRRLERAVVEHEPIGIFGDYDVDGVTSCAVLTSFLRAAGAEVIARVATRNAGYGFGVADAQAFFSAHARLILTCDCGTSDHQALALSAELGMDVVVVDHHQVPDPAPVCFALINPHQASCQFPFKGLASVGVAFYLAAALKSRLRAIGRESLPDPRDLLDLVLIGTIGDMVPLAEENRILARAGMGTLNSGRRPGLRALAELAGIGRGECRAVDVAMKIAPRLNAPGRLGDAQLALDLCLARDDVTARALALACEDANRQRQAIQKEVLAEAVAQIEAGPLGRAAHVVAGAWHPGVVGVVAAKLVDRYARPAVVIAFEGDIGRGSARSFGGFHLVEGLKSARDLLVRFGGHAAAAGLTIERARLPELAEHLDRAARAHAAGATPGHVLEVDAEISLDEIHEPLIDEIERLGPFGAGHREPILAVRGVQLERSRVVGEHHLQVTLRDGLSARDGIAFNFAPQDPGAGATVRCAFVPEVDRFRGCKRVRVRVHDLCTDSSRRERLPDL